MKIGESFEPGQICRGAVTSINDSCLTVELEEGISGTVTAANLSWRRVEHPSQVAAIGQKVTVVFLSFDPDRGHISLSLKDLETDPFITFARTQLGESSFGEVVKMTPIGAFVRLPSGIEALLPISEQQASGGIGVGDSIQVMIKYINLRRRQVRLSLH
ncbi:S1 RNA-binding domain-containing protein [Streptomyces sp. NPDC029003]|uniref:S1 RNA-binding domain-containing protein n=1 Tax=Streptomyces sp. NPDC029003 TaxID=3155125 RepID=UPI0033ED438B